MRKTYLIMKVFHLKALVVLLLFFFHLPAFSNPVVIFDDERLEKAAELFQRGDYEKAIARYEKATKNTNLAVEANLGLARVFIETGDYDKAKEACQQALSVSPNHPDALNLQGELFKLTGKYDTARAKFREALKFRAGYLQARLNLGIMQWEWGEKSAARETLQYFINYFYNHPNLTANEFYLIAQACIYLDRFRDANNLFREATASDSTFWQAYISWGNLFLSKYNTSDAFGVFEDALKINPNSAEAHLGLAKCWKYSDFEKATQAAQKALTINPSLVGAHDFLAELEIATSDYDSALEKIEAALEINPNSLTSRTLKALSHFALKNEVQFLVEKSELLDINPKYANLYFEIADFLSKRYLFKESVEYYKKALELDSENWLARAGLGTSLSRLGKEEAAIRELENAFNRDPYNKHVGNLLTLFDDFSEYRTHQLQNFTVRIHERDDSVLWRYVQELVNQSYLELVGKYNIKDVKPAILEIFPEHDDFAVRCFGLPGAQAFLGICFGNVVAMDSPQARSKGDFVWGETLWHELVHVTHLRLTENRIPRWLAEGIAVYETSTANPHWHMNLDIPFIRAFRNDRILPLKDLDSGFNRPTNPGQVTLSYFQASLVVEYLVEKYGHPKLQETFPKFKSDMETEPVFKEVYGKDLDALNEEFVDYVNDKYNFEQVDYDFNPRDLAAHSKDMETYLLEKVVEKPNNPFLNNHLGMYYKKNGELDQALQHLTKAKELFPNYVSGESPYKSIAEIYLKQGKKQAAIAELNELTSLNGKDLESLNLLADLCVETQDYDCAIEAFQKIIFITPFEPEIHKEMASVYMKKKQYQMAIEEFRTLLLTEPQDMAGAHCDLAEAYLKADKKADAKKSALAALEIAPNYERAQEILLACVE